MFVRFERTGMSFLKAVNTSLNIPEEGIKQTLTNNGRHMVYHVCIQMKLNSLYTDLFSGKNLYKGIEVH